MILLFLAYILIVLSVARPLQF